MTVEIKICMGNSCFSRSNAQNIEMIEQYIKDNNLDAKVQLTGTKCEGRCEFGPNVFVDGVCHGNMTPENILKLLEGLKL